MLAEILIFTGATLSTVLYLMISQCLRNKLTINFRQFSFYKWAGDDILSEISRSKVAHTDFLRSGKSVLTLIMSSTFTIPLVVNVILL